MEVFKKADIRKGFRKIFKRRLVHAVKKVQVVTNTLRRPSFENQVMNRDRSHETVHSRDGRWSIRIGNKITEAKEKDVGSTVQVLYGSLLELANRSMTREEERKMHMIQMQRLRPQEGIETVLSIAGTSDADSLRIQLGTNQPNVAPVYEEVQEIIVKVFATRPSSKQPANADHEIRALKRLTALNCQHAPQYLGDFSLPLNSLVGGVVRYVLMTKVPGLALSDRAAWPPWYFRRSKVKSAFDVAIRAVHACDVFNGSPWQRNVVYDEVEDICYIVDFERAQFVVRADMPWFWSNFEYWEDSTKED